MNWQFWQGSSPQSLPESVWRVVATQRNVEVSQIATMRYVQKRGKFAGRRVRQIRIFDPAQLPSPGAGRVSYDALDAHRGAILFDGLIEGDGSVGIFDRRQPKGAQAEPTLV